MTMIDPKKQAEINGLLTGPPTAGRPAPQQIPDQPVAEHHSELTPPSWWGGDDQASSSSQIAAAQATSR